jgi:hypothetical protein
MNLASGVSWSVETSSYLAMISLAFCSLSAATRFTSFVERIRRPAAGGVLENVRP